ncbi:MAG: exodeoxyribonuclease VII small subunit [Candidatus Aminicenantes bacterium]|nr:exodeoxyribonuclease VII small subunit [Candidatus Aminicenantes bacterium]
MSDKSKTYEENYMILEKITESLNKDEIGIDDLVTRTKEALEAARTCMDILKKQRGEFKKLEKEFSQLLDKSEKAQDLPDEEGISSAEPDES